MPTTLNGVTVADPYDYQANLVYLGGQRRSINGSVLVVYFFSTPKYTIVLQWRLLTSAQRTALQTQFNNAVTQQRTLVIPDGRSFSVYLDLNTDIAETMIRTAQGYVYNIAATFIEA